MRSIEDAFLLICWLASMSRSPSEWRSVLMHSSIRECVSSSLFLVCCMSDDELRFTPSAIIRNTFLLAVSSPCMTFSRTVLLPLLVSDSSLLSCSCASSCRMRHDFLISSTNSFLLKVSIIRCAMSATNSVTKNISRFFQPFSHPVGSLSVFSGDPYRKVMRPCRKSVTTNTTTAHTNLTGTKKSPTLKSALRASSCCASVMPLLYSCGRPSMAARRN
mmetsp:Transcript_15805/g.37688  ORF Transcript_15805/g.37688 Transcript_15805/m.37688 type:complete len:218 (-) Transcript_15805:654-1307(-)